MRSRPEYDVVIVGLGYVGLSTAVCFASRGFKVRGIDVDADKVKKVSSGVPVIHEAMLKEMLQEGISKGNLSFGTEFDDEASSGSFIFITVGTPSNPDGSMETKYVKQAVEEISIALSRTGHFQTVVMKSTVIPGTTYNFVKPTLERLSGKKVGKGIGLCVNPELLREGSAIKDTLNPDALIIGREDTRSERVILDLYKRFYSDLPPLILTSFTNAEMIKYAVNSFRGVQLSFLNSLANLAGALQNADVGEIIDGFAKITRVDNRYLRPGPGFGGSCLPKDMKALLSLMRNMKVDPILLEAALKINDNQPKVIVSIAEKEAEGLRGKRVALLGLAYKGGTDDVRDSPSLRIAKQLLDNGARVVAFDPAAVPKTREVLGNSIKYSDTLAKTLSNADIAIVATDWPEFREIKPDEFKRLMKRAVVIDTRRILNVKDYQGSGVKLVTIGTSKSTKLGDEKNE
ncbi:MAG: UDP-glucose/GDP-mannose dehydrogenase family protein [Conexivisphaerales archaeon]